MLILGNINWPVRAAGSANEVFPLSQGTSWTYSGLVRWTLGGSNKVFETKVTWKTEVLRVISRNGLSVAVIRGFPNELDWSDGHPSPEDSLIVRSSQGGFYLIGPEATETALHRLNDPTDFLKDLLSDDQLFLELPLKESRKFCDPEGMARPDGMYCWVVNAPKSFSLAHVMGVAPRRAMAYELEYRTSPDTIDFALVPGIGIVSYEYHHHGTVADTELRLVEFRAGR